MNIRARFAPSPTGFLHIGGLRTALYNYLVAKKAGGKFILRIEDTDRTRFVEGALESLLKSLKWAGIEPDEGVTLDEDNKIVQKGDCGPYEQSQRLELYQKYAHELLDNDQAYYCFCTTERLEELRKIQEANKQPTGYDGFCRSIHLDEAKNRIQQGEGYVIRMKMPKDGETIIDDLIRGKITFKNSLVDDQVIIKSDGFPTYHLALVVDDHLMEIDPTIRGDEWLSSTPKHVQLYKYFNWEMPPIAHLPLILNPDKSKLSKRQGDVAVEDYIKKGYLPEAVVNFIALLGWNPGTEQEIFSMDELIQTFDLTNVNKSGAIFNLDKLNWFNKQYLMKMSGEELVERAKPFLTKAGLVEDVKPRGGHVPGWLEKVVALGKERSNTLVELIENVRFIFADDLVYEPALLVWKKSTADETKLNLAKLSEFLTNLTENQWGRGELEQNTLEWIKSNQFGIGDFLWPMRVAMSGQQNSPGPFEIAEVLGKEETLKRIDKAIKIL